MPPLPAEPVVSDADEESETQAVQAPPERAALAYDPETGRAQVSRRQFRFLLILTLVNTLMLGGFVAGPGLSKLVGGWWRDYQHWRAGREAARQRQAARDKFMADYRQLLAYSEPADKVLHEEDQERAAKLVAQRGYVPERPSGSFSYFTPKPWQFPAVAPQPIALQMLTGPRKSTGALLFLHGRKTPAGPERLVWVVLDASQTAQDYGIQAATTPGGPLWRYSRIETRRLLHGGVYSPTEKENELTGAGQRSLEVEQNPSNATTVTWTQTTSWENGTIDIDPKQVMRFFAGQPDPNNPSHFTIAYEVDGRRELLDGLLHDDDSVTLEPRQGRIVYGDPSGRNRRWDPYAEPPATAPTTKPRSSVTPQSGTARSAPPGPAARSSP
jgi:hypothetical protein